MTGKSSLLLLSFVSLLVMSGCATIDVHGHEITPDQVAKIKVGTTTKEQVTQILGTPTAVSTFGTQTWFYMSEITQRRAFFNPSVLKSNTTRIEFNEQGRVKVLDSLTEKDKQVVAHVHRSTPTAGHTFGVLEQIFGNVGRFNGKDPDQ